MGIIRLLLALAVIATHFGGIWNLNLVGGQVAVQSFYIISGFYMSLILNEKYVGKNNSFKLFITNRFLRLYPIYGIVLLFTIIFCILLTVLTDRYSVLSNYLSYHTSFFSLLYLILTNVLIFGQDLVMFLGINVDNGHLFFTSNYSATSPQLYNFLFVPQAWTLGLEIMFYLIAPFVLKKGFKVLGLIIIMSILVRFIIYNILRLQNDAWSTRFFPSEISFFLLGYVSYRIYLKTVSILIPKYIYLIVLFGLILFTIIFNFLPALKFTFLPFSFKEIIYFFCIMISTPLLFRFLKKNKFDNQIGELSYPVYISHMFVGFVCLSTNNYFLKQGWAIALLTIFMSMVLNYYVSKPIERFRQSRLIKIPIVNKV
jgi:peptidoglycan/LPS O-acetylase OafA/YrhL